MAPRTSSTTPNEIGRMPFVHAEALLWWPELRKQHEWLLTEMRTLQNQHNAYNARIQTTEAVAEAAEAATSKIRHMEQQIAAMGAVDGEKAFEKWAAEEITRMKISVEGNQAVRQKQIELGKRISNVVDDVAKFEQWLMSLGNVQQRLEGLEEGRKKDTAIINALEEKIARLEGMQKVPENNPIDMTADMNGQHGSGIAEHPALILGGRELEADVETEDEDCFPCHEQLSEQIQVPRSPEIPPKNVERCDLFTVKAAPHTSARLRLLKRSSIHNSKAPKLHCEDQHDSRGLEPKPPSHVKDRTLETQLVNRANARKRKIPDRDVPTGRMTRSQAKNQGKKSGQPVVPQSKDIPCIELAQSAATITATRKEFNAGPSQAKMTFVQPIQVVGASPTKRKLPTDSEQNGHVSANILKRRKPDNGSVPRAKEHHDEHKVSNGFLRHLAAPVKSSSRKVASHQSACLPCRQRHRACDRARPACGECTKRTQSHACRYLNVENPDTSNLLSTPSSRLKLIPLNTVGGTSRPSVVIAREKKSFLPFRPINTVQELAVTGPSARRALLPTVVKSSTVTNSVRRAMPDITDYNTYLRLRAEEKIP